MPKPSNQLALRPSDPEEARRQVVFRNSDHEPRYSVDPVALGEFAVQWTADRFAGMFSITDLPADWVAFIQHSIHGPWKESRYDGPAPFSVVLWNSMPFDDRVSEWIFSQVRLDIGQTEHHDGMLGNVLDSIRDAEVRDRQPSPAELPLRNLLALPDESTSTLG